MLIHQVIEIEILCIDIVTNGLMAWVLGSSPIGRGEESDNWAWNQERKNDFTWEVMQRERQSSVKPRENTIIFRSRDSVRRKMVSFGSL